MAADGSERFVLLNRLADEFAARYRRGERPSLQEYIDRHPELADDIREFFPALVEMEQVKEDRQGAPGPAATGPLPPLERLGDYRLIRQIGSGGMGVVYEAEQVSLGRRVALKVLPQTLLVGTRTRQRFEREARAAAKLHHTNIVPVFGVGEHDGLPYYVMQFIQGLGLDEVLEELKHLQSGEKSGGSGPRRSDGDFRVCRRDVTAADVARSLVSGAFAPAAGEEEDAVGVDSDMTVDQPPSPPTLSPPGGRRASSSPLSPAAGERGRGGRAAPAKGSAAPAPAAGPLSDSFSVSSSVVLPGSARQAGRKRATYWQSVARIGVQVAEALEYAHKQGVQHRDIKPSNLLLDTTGTVWVTDFGLAKTDDQQNLTHAGDVLGTLRYMPPEAFEGKTDARGDVYALGLTLYELLAFRPAFDEQERKRLLKKVMTADAPRLDRLNREVPRDLVTIVHKASERDPAHRYATAGELAADLQRFLDDEPIRARRQTQLERYLRWARRHPGIAVLGGVLTAVLLAITVGSVLVAAHFQEQEQEQRQLVRSKAALAEGNQRLADENEAAKKAAEDARKRAEITLVDMQAARGLLAAERDDPARALLWFAEAAAGASSEPRRQEDNLLRARNWARHLTLPVRAFPLGGRSAKVLEFRPGGDLLLLLTDDRLFVRDWRQDKFLPWANDVPKVGAACWSPDGDWLAVGYHSGVVEIRGVPDGRILQEVKHPGAITALAFSPDGQRLALAGTEVRDWRNSRTVLPWDLVEQKTSTLFGETVVQLLDLPSRTLLPGGWKHPQPVHSLAFNRAGDRLITASMDKKARVFAGAGGPDRPAPLFNAIPHQPRFPWPPVLVENDRRLITLSWYGMDQGKPTELTVWDVETGKPAGPGAVPARPSYPPRVVASPRGDWFATSGHWGPEVWKTAAAGDKSVYFSDHTGYVEDLVPSQDGKVLLSASWDRTARLWSVPDGTPLGSPLPHMGNVTRCAVASDDIHLATLADGVARIWRRSDGALAGVQPATWWGITRPSFDGRLLAPGIWHEEANHFRPIGGGELRVLRASTGEPAGPVIALRGQLVDSCVCADNRTVAAVSEENGSGWLSLNDVATGKALTPPKSLPGAPRSVAARPSSTQVAVLCAGGELLVFDSRSGEKVLGLSHGGQPAPGRTARAQYTADGATLVSLTQGSEEAAHVWDAATGAPRCPPIRPVLKGGPLRTFALSADGRLLATAVNGKNAAQVWDLATGRALSPPLPHPGDHYGLFCLCFSPDGRYLLTGGKDRQGRLWDWQAATLACPPLKHEEEVFAVAMTPDGRFALTGGRARAGQLHVWELTTGRLVAPKVPLPASVVSLSIPPAGPRVVASCSGNVARIDLARLLAPPEMPLEDYRLLGELASGQRIEQGDENGLTQDEWLQRLNQFNQRHPAYGRPGPAGVVTLHRKAAQSLRDTDRPLAALAHYREALLELDRAGGDAPGDRALRAAVLRDRAAALTRLGRAEAATADLGLALELEPRPKPRPEEGPALAALGDAAAEIGDWSKAAEYFTQAKELAPDDWRLWHAHLLLCLQRKDAVGYRKGCAELLRRFGKTDNAVLANNIAWFCALGPDAVRDLSGPVSLSQKAVGKAGHWVHRSTLGTVLYRAGKQDQAVEQFNAAMKENPSGGTAWDWVALAMAHHRLGHEDEARRWLAKAAAFVGELRQGKLPEHGGTGQPLRWQERLELELLLREAEALIGAKAGPAE
jgi:serine/threonine protein kinase/WD40 repeat protein/tetratricopeptide (TPR) repeat protein